MPATNNERRRTQSSDRDDGRLEKECHVWQCVGHWGPATDRDLDHGVDRDDGEHERECHVWQCVGHWGPDRDLRHDLRRDLHHDDDGGHEKECRI